MSLAVGAAAVVGSAMLGACAPKDEMKEKPAESTTPRPSATAPASPTEKAVAPSPRQGSSGENSFAPSVTARPAPTALPGNVITGG
jgi:hypothetical protein